MGLVSSQSYGQTNNLNQPVSLSVKETPLREVLILIENQAEVSFAYNSDKLPLEALVTYNSDNKSLESVLTYISNTYHLRFELIEKQIALLPNPSIAPLTFVLNGSINDKKSGESLIGATIRVDGVAFGSISNGYGYYSLTLPYGKHSLSISYLGYELQEDSINLISNIKLDISLHQGSPELHEVIVQAIKPPKVESIQMGKITIPPKLIVESPATLGESDVIKSLERIPGIKLQSEGSTFFYVRGGNKDQNLILIDDAPIYNPTHMLGLFSTIVPETTNSIDIYKSNFPVSKGGKLSSVIDIKTKEGNKHRLSSWGNIGLVSTHLGIEGPLKKGKSSFILTGRKSRIKWFFKQEIPDLEKFSFYDLTGKANFKLNTKNKLYLSFYTGSDKFLTSETGLEWSNFNGSVRWNKIINDNTFVNTTLYGSNYEYFFHESIQDSSSWRSRIGEIGLKSDFTTFISRNQEVSWGFNIIGRTINPGNLISKDSIPPSQIVSVKNNLETVGYVQYSVKAGDKWGFKMGVRASAWTSVGESFEFIFNASGYPTDTLDYVNGEAYHNYLQIEPRISTSYFITKNSSIKASFDRTSQNLHLITNSISPFTSFEVWLPSGPNIKPQVGNQVALGYYHFLPNLGVSLEAETYAKQLKNQIDYASHAATLINPVIESELVFGTTNSYGIELFAKKEEGRIRGMIGYTLSKATSKFKDINDGNSFVAFSDRPHHVSINLNYDVGQRVTLSSNFIYTTGMPFSSPTSFYLYDGNEIPVYENKNNSRFPDYHRMDISAKFKLNKNLNKRFKHSIIISIYNIYGRKNPVFINFNKTIKENGDFEVPTDLLTATRVSSQFFIYRVAPSINYQFRF